MRRTPPTRWLCSCIGGGSTSGVPHCHNGNWQMPCWMPAPTWCSDRIPTWCKTCEFLPPAMPGEGARLVAFSLGNFVFDQGWGDTGQGLALRLLFDEDGLCAAQALPLWTSPRPRWMNEQDAAALLDRILPLARLAFACSDDRCWSVPASADTQRVVLRRSDRSHRRRHERDHPAGGRAGADSRSGGGCVAQPA